MCLVLLSLRAHDELPLVVLANRDEFRARPTATASWWSDAPDVFAGRDLEKMGTWFGVTRSAHFACVTNVRDPAARREGKSRGAVVRGWLEARTSLDDYVDAIDGAEYAGFNAIFGDGLDLRYVRDDRRGGERVPDGLHGLSNARLDVYWPKVELGLRKLDAILRRPMTPNAEPFFDILADRSLADDVMLPTTGVPLDWERRLSAAHITGAEYGTRAATVMLVHRSGAVYVEERTFDGSEGSAPVPRAIAKATLEWKT